MEISCFEQKRSLDVPFLAIHEDLIEMESFYNVAIVCLYISLIGYWLMSCNFTIPSEGWLDASY